MKFQFGNLFKDSEIDINFEIQDEMKFRGYEVIEGNQQKEDKSASIK